MRYLMLVLLLGNTSYAGDDSWFCREAASERRGSVLLACGVDTDSTENGARKKALAAALEELDTICGRSADCKENELQIDPQRTDCQKEKGGYKCYRALRATITSTKRKETYAKGESIKAALEKIEITVKHEITTKGGGLGFYSVPSCEADIKPLSDALLDLSTQAKRDHVANEAVKVPFSTECAKVHVKLLSILARNKLTLPKYTDFVIKGLEGIADPSANEDYRAQYALEYFHAPGQMPDKEWKASLSVVCRAHYDWRLLSQLFYPEVTGSSEQALEKKRVDAFFSAVERGEYGKPVAKGPDEAVAGLIRAVTEHGKDRRNWLGLHAYARFRPSLKYDKGADRVSDALQTLSQAGDEEKGRNWVNEWMAELSQKAGPSRQLSLSLEKYVEHFDEEVKKQDDEEDSGARNIKLAKALKASFISKAGASLGKHLNVTYDDSDRRQRGIFCLKQGISCPDLVPEKDRLVKLLRSKKADKRVEALGYLRHMPKVAQSLEDDLIINLNEEAAQAGLDHGEYMSRIHAEVIHVLANLPSPSVKVFRRLIELNFHVNDREDRDKLQPGWEPQLMIALKHQNVAIRSNAARLLEYFDKLSDASCAKLMRDTKGREPTSYNDYEANVASHKCKGRPTDWGD